MSKKAEELLNNLESDEYDVLDDIQESDFVFVVSGTGQLRGISFPIDMKNEDEVDSNVEEIINFIVKKFAEVRLENTTLH